MAIRSIMEERCLGGRKMTLHSMILVPHPTPPRLLHPIILAPPLPIHPPRLLHLTIIVPFTPPPPHAFPLTIHGNNTHKRSDHGTTG